MKARVKATGEIVTIMKNIGYPGGYVASNGRTYYDEALTLIVDEGPDYWTRLEHQAAIAAMQGLCANPQYPDKSWDEMATDAAIAAHALVEKYKKEEK